MGDVFREELRETDFAARFGGDEFVALLPHQTATEAAVVAERLRTRLATRAWPWPQPLTVSVGVAAMESAGHVQDPSMLLAAADAALYRSKHSGAEPGRGGRPRRRAPGGHSLRTAPWSRAGHERDGAGGGGGRRAGRGGAGARPLPHRSGTRPRRWRRCSTRGTGRRMGRPGC